jgi:peroxiredoxin family protein
MTIEHVEQGLSPEIQARIDEAVAAKFSELLEGQIKELTQAKAASKPEKKGRRLAIVASKGTLDMAYPPLILASSAAALGWKVGVFFTFYGLDIINRKKNRHLAVAPLGNPAMPVPVPNIVGAIPGMTSMATWMMKRWMKSANMPTVQDLLDICVQSGVELIPCSTTMGVMKVEQNDLLDGLECSGAAAFLDFAADADVTIFV